MVGFGCFVGVFVCLCGSCFNSYLSSERVCVTLCVVCVSLCLLLKSGQASILVSSMNHATHSFASIDTHIAMYALLAMRVFSVFHCAMCVHQTENYHEQ